MQEHDPRYLEPAREVLSHESGQGLPGCLGWSSRSHLHKYCKRWFYPQDYNLWFDDAILQI